MNLIGKIATATVAIVAVLAVTGQAYDRMGPEARRREVRDKVGSVPERILKLQSIEKVQPPSIDGAIAIALKAAKEAARPLI